MQTIKVPRARLFKALNVEETHMDILKAAGYTGVTFTASTNSNAEVHRSFCSCGCGSTELLYRCARCGGEFINLSYKRNHWDSSYNGDIYITELSSDTQRIDFFEATLYSDSDMVEVEMQVKEHHFAVISGDAEGWVRDIKICKSMGDPLGMGAPNLRVKRIKEKLEKIVPKALEVIAEFGEGNDYNCHYLTTALMLSHYIPNFFNNSKKYGPFMNYVVQIMNVYGEARIPECPSSSLKEGWDATTMLWTELTDIDRLAWVVGIPPEVKDYNKAAITMRRNYYNYKYLESFNDGVRDFLATSVGQFMVYRWRSGLMDIYDIMRARKIYGDNSIPAEDWDLAEKYIKERCDVFESPITLLKEFVADCKFYHSIGIYPSEDNLRARMVSRNRRLNDYVEVPDFEDLLIKNPLDALKALSAARTETV